MSSLDVRAIKEEELRKRPAPAVKQSFRVFLAEEAFDRAVARGATDTTREIGGVLVGEVLRDAAGPYLLVETTVDALHADEKGAELTFTHATWEHINKEMDTHHQGKRVVGWYHTHPGFGVFLSDRDQFIHKSFFNLPFQVALVYDPKSREHAVFTWQDNEIQRARRYWVGDREQLWDAARTSDEARDRGSDRDGRGDREGRDGRASANPRKAEPVRELEPLLDSSMGTIVTLGAVGLILLLVGAFVGNWWASGNASQVIAHAQTELAKAKSEGAQLAIAQLDTELVSLLRQTLGDAALRAPIQAAVTELDGAIATLDAQAASDPKAKETAANLRDARDRLRQLATDQTLSAIALAKIEARTRLHDDVRADLAQAVAEQRAGISALYAELAADVAKTDKARAKRLLAMAARLDPGNRARFEAQLRTFDKTGSLPRELGTGSPAPTQPRDFGAAPSTGDQPRELDAAPSSGNQPRELGAAPAGASQPQHPGAAPAAGNQPQQHPGAAPAAGNQPRALGPAPAGAQDPGAAPPAASQPRETNGAPTTGGKQ